MSECVLPEFYEEDHVAARKPHRCCETGRLIEAGQRYWRCRGKWDGEFAVHKQCESAYHFARALNEYHRDVGDARAGECVVGFGQVADDVGELRSEEPGIAELWDAIREGRAEFGPDDSLPRAW